MNISIIVPVYNSEAYLEKSINSILNQSYKDFELILLDDGSTDNSFEICNFFAQKDKRIRAVHIENRGVSAVRNLGLTMAKGTYIRFFDADDIMPEDSLQNLLEPFLDNNRIDMVIGSFDSNDSKIYKGNDMSGIKSVSELMPHYVTYARSFYYGVVWNKLYQADIIRGHGIEFDTDFQWSEDLLFNLKYLDKCQRIYYVNKPVCYYYRRKASLSKTLNGYNNEELFLIECQTAHCGRCEQHFIVGAFTSPTVRFGR